MSLKPQPYTTLPGARFQPLDTEEGLERYDLLEVSDDSVDYADLFGGGDVNFVVHEGSLSLSGPTSVQNEEQRVCVIEGDLIVDGPLVIHDVDVYVPLWIKGSLIARDLLLVDDAQVFIEGDLKLSGNLVTEVTDAAHLVVHGEAKIGAWLRPSERGAIYLPESVPDPIEGDALKARLVPTLNSSQSWSEHVLEGKRLLRD
ncbi:hypothetical protein LXT21_31560 [Myxococcus sp. K38C18041901]|uniref:hypothetical protein n=1 Tax=Myxococcus guangdongensis TaxID=2906760 RepID=UPI0020A70C8F|nr:hypothetical protein [Myxococcus guangdongensis]MCP3063326.1 hypothetical protein [Myxococcus guangdongensis]